MRIYDMNWMQLEQYLKHDNRIVLPLGSTEQHAYLSLGTDSILAERVALEAAEPLGIPVLPPLNFGITPTFLAYPGSVSLRVETYFRILADILNSLYGQGFRRFLIINGHGGNMPAQGWTREWMTDHPQAQVKFHNWWEAPRVWAKVQAIDPIASHASWMENFPWTRLENVILPTHQKAPVNINRVRLMGAEATRAELGDGNFAGLYQRPDEEMLELWKVGVEETRELLETGWL